MGDEVGQNQRTLLPISHVKRPSALFEGATKSYEEKKSDRSRTNEA